MEIKRGDIWYVSKDNYTGCEQAAGRPAIIVSNEKNNACAEVVEVVWDTGRRRRAWLADFTEEERRAAGRLFKQARNWTVGRGVPYTVQMSRKTFHLWQKLGDFCASI